MALMTTCPICNTSFKVVPDQLLLHHGMVRCGACDHVFDANHHLESLPEGSYAETALKRSPNAPISPALHDTHWSNKPAVQALINAGEQTQADSPAWTDLLGTSFTELKLDSPSAIGFFEPPKRLNNLDIPTTLLPNAGHIADGIALIDLSTPSPILPKPSLSTLALSPLALSPPTELEPAALSDIEQTEKLARRKARAAARRAEIKTVQDQKSQAKALRLNKDNPKLKPIFQARAQSISARLGKVFSYISVGVCGLSVAALMLQTLMWARYPIMNVVPMTSSVFGQLCQLTGCRHNPAVWLKPLSLDGLSLSKLPATQNMAVQGMASYRMQATIRNSSNLTVQSPDIELTISSLEGAILARKVLPSNTFKPLPVSQGSLPASTDWVIDASIDLDKRTDGYAARLVYLF
jgi:predicted Zn finger-like uncharacterized protein